MLFLETGWNQNSSLKLSVFLVTDFGYIFTVVAAKQMPLILLRHPSYLAHLWWATHILYPQPWFQEG